MTDELKELVDFLPKGPRVNAMINYLNSNVDVMSKQQFADLLSSSVAAVAYVMFSTNEPKRIKELFAFVVDDAYAQFEQKQNDR